MQRAQWLCIGEGAHDGAVGQHPVRECRPDGIDELVHHERRPSSREHNSHASCMCREQRVHRALRDVAGGIEQCSVEIERHQPRQTRAG